MTSTLTPDDIALRLVLSKGKEHHKKLGKEAEETLGLSGAAGIKSSRAIRYENISIEFDPAQNCCLI